MAGSLSRTPLEIGLVMAGAISAGAYTAGVADFLIQALNEWEKARKQDESAVPKHEVKLRVIAGASAGGMTGAVIAAMLNEEIRPITSLPDSEPSREDVSCNKLYEAWIERIDIRELLDGKDLKDNHRPVLSLLDSSILESIAEQAISFKPTHLKPAWLCDTLHLFLTLTNLQGIPYDIRFMGLNGKDEYIINNHGDFMHFEMRKPKPEKAETTWLNPEDASHPNWMILKQAAIATGAFPVGLAPRFIQRPFTNYLDRRWKIPMESENNGETAMCGKSIAIHPSWPSHRTSNYDFVAVDGGVVDNEPFDLAHDFLSGENGYNERDPGQVRRTILMIDPFPNLKKSPLVSPSDFKDYDLLKVIGKLFGSLIDQARFKPEELILAMSNDIYSRFLIAPTRRESNGNLASYPIASGCLGGFGGFLSKKFRMHDFQLGRRNCQQFLRRHFVLPIDKARINPLFNDFTAEDFVRFADISDEGPVIPIIPLFGSADDPIEPVSWASIKMNREEIKDIQNRVSHRTKIVTNRLLEQYIKRSLTRRMAKTLVWMKRKKIVNGIMKKITEELKEFDLLTE